MPVSIPNRANNDAEAGPKGVKEKEEGLGETKRLPTRTELAEGKRKRTSFN